MSYKKRSVTGNRALALPALLLLFASSPAVGAPCTTSADCMSGAVCEAGSCVTASSTVPDAPASEEAASPPEVVIVELPEEALPPEKAPEPPAPEPPVKKEAPPVVAPTPPPPEPPPRKLPPRMPRVRGFEEGYAAISFALSAISFGHEITWNALGGAPYAVKTLEGVLPGFRVAYFATESGNRHTGVYFTFKRGHDIVYDRTYRDRDVSHSHFSTGLGNRYGGMPGGRVWLGAELDFGLDVQKNSWPGGNEEVYYGPEVMVQFCIDIYAVKKPRFKLTVPIGLGVDVVLFSVRRSSASGRTVINWDVSPVALVGVALGG